jgi:hypothetical protein
MAGLFIDPADIFSDDTYAEQLYSSQEEYGNHNGCPAGNSLVKD